MRHIDNTSPRRIALIFMFCAPIFAGSCAQKGFPPGGPPDVTPPNVSHVYPDSGASRVALNAPISITFDDKMDRRSVEGAFNMTPPTDMESLNWDNKVLTVALAGSLIENRTYTILFSMGMKDRRGNKTKQPVIIHFSTGDSVAQGVVKGKVETGKARPPSVMMWAYRADNCPPEHGLTSPAGVGQADSKGEFTIGGLDTHDAYCVFGHLDRDADNELDEDDLFIGADSTVSFVPDSSIVSGLVIYLVPDDEPGTITGTVVDSTGPELSDYVAVVLPRNKTSAAEDSTTLGRSVEEADSTLGQALGDSTLSPVVVAAPMDTMALKRAIADSVYSAAKIIVLAFDVADSANYAQTEIAKAGEFSLKGLSPGVYRLTVFRDLNRDKAVTAGREPVARLDGVIIKPGRITDTGALILRRESTEVENR